MTPHVLHRPVSRALTIAPFEPRIVDVRLASVAAILAVLFAGVAQVSAQTLGDVAKKEAERRKAVATPGKVYTNDNLRNEPPPSVSSPAQPAAAPAGPAAQVPPASPDAQTTSAQTAGTAKPAADAAPTTEEGWRQRITGARDALTRSQMFAEALQSRINALNTDFVNRDDPVQRNAIAAERQKALAELDRVKQEIVDQQKAITMIQDEARRAGVPPGWIR